MDHPIVSVSEAVRYVKQLLDSDANLQWLAIRGELSNFKRHSSGHLYFTIKDSGAVLRSVMFRTAANSLRFQPRDGLRVVAFGRIAIYERDGSMQLYVDRLMPDGIGDLSLAYQQLKEKLEQEGLFASVRKRPLPRLPRRVGIITSPTGAALRDIVTVGKRRFPTLPFVLFPVLVQGDEAPGEIVLALQCLAALPEVDVIILGRGGGSLEELWAFNDERVVRAIAACKIPVISAVGHETDFTLSDFVADVRAATPSQGAELAIPDRLELENQLQRARVLLTQGILHQVKDRKLVLQRLLNRGPLARPKESLQQMQIRVDQLSGRLQAAWGTLADGKKRRFHSAMDRLGALNPLAVLNRGFVLVTDRDEQPVVSVRQIQREMCLSLRFTDGRCTALVQTKEEQDGNG